MYLSKLKLNHQSATALHSSAVYLLRPQLLLQLRLIPSPLLFLMFAINITIKTAGSLDSLI